MADTDMIDDRLETLENELATGKKRQARAERFSIFASLTILAGYLFYKFVWPVI